jgi:hypothetical protein
MATIGAGAPPAFHLLAKPTGAVCHLDCSYSGDRTSDSPTTVTAAPSATADMPQRSRRSSSDRDASDFSLGPKTVTAAQSPRHEATA